MYVSSRGPRHWLAHTRDRYLTVTECTTRIHRLPTLPTRVIIKPFVTYLGRPAAAQFRPDMLRVLREQEHNDLGQHPIARKGFKSFPPHGITCD
jgi:hypothetical protein